MIEILEPVTGPEQPASKADRLAQRLLEDRRPRPQSATQIAECFACSRSYVAKPRAGDDSSHFCSIKCREAFDGGFMPAADPDPFTVERWRAITGPGPGFMPGAMTRASAGFRIACRGCGRVFESRGLAFCDPDCERKQRQRKELAATMAEVGMESIREKRPCQHPGCPNSIPLWRNKRKVSVRARFCDLHSGLSQASKPSQAPSQPGAFFQAELLQETPAAQGSRIDGEEKVGAQSGVRAPDGAAS